MQSGAVNLDGAETHDVYVAESGERERLQQLAADASRPNHQHLRRLPPRAPRRTHAHQEKP